MVQNNDPPDNKKFNAMTFMFVLFAALGISFTWFLTCGFVRAMAFLFEFHFSWELGTNVWLVLVAIEVVFEIVNHHTP